MRLLYLVLTAGALFAAQPEPKLELRGKLIAGPDLATSDRGNLVLEGDADTTKVLNDKRLAGMDLEVIGHFTALGRFQIDPSYTKSLFVLKDGKKLLVTYWCATCSLRTHTPGKCWCCQQETELDLREWDEP